MEGLEDENFEEPPLKLLRLLSRDLESLARSQRAASGAGYDLQSPGLLVLSGDWASGSFGICTSFLVALCCLMTPEISEFWGQAVAYRRGIMTFSLEFVREELPTVPKKESKPICIPATRSLDLFFRHSKSMLC